MQHVRARLPLDPQQQRAQRVADGGEDQGHARELKDGEEAVGDHAGHGIEYNRQPMTRGKPTTGSGAVVLLLLLGVGLFAFVQTHPSTSRDAGPRRHMSWVHVAVIILAIALAGTPASRGGITRLLDRARKPSPRARRLTAGAVFVVAIGYILLT